MFMFPLWSWLPNIIVGCCCLCFFCGHGCLTPLLVAIDVHVSFMVMVPRCHWWLLLLFMLPLWSCSLGAINYCKHHHDFSKYFHMLLFMLISWSCLLSAIIAYWCCLFSEWQGISPLFCFVQVWDVGWMRTYYSGTFWARKWTCFFVHFVWF
jgi:hypothetical protein